MPETLELPSSEELLESANRAAELAAQWYNENNNQDNAE